MTETIWKAELPNTGSNFVIVPTGAVFLTAREQHEKICVWFRCDPRKPTESRTLWVCGTGWGAPPPGRYLGMCSLQGGSIIFHVWEPL